MRDDYTELRYMADIFFDAQEARKALENRVLPKTSKDGEIISPVIESQFFDSAIKHYRSVEEEASKAMRKAMKRTVGPGILEWQQAQPGIGEHLLARLLGAIGDPRVKIPMHWEGRGRENRILVAGEASPRTVGQLWAYCGHGDPARIPRKGMSAEEVLAVGNKAIKSLVWNMATACVKTGVRTNEDETKYGTGHYAEVYLARRVVTADRVHAEDCIRCGPSGKPALKGSPWPKAHQHADALRVLGKEILRDLWIAAGPTDHETHKLHADAPQSTAPTSDSGAAKRTGKSKMFSPAAGARRGEKVASGRTSKEVTGPKPGTCAPARRAKRKTAVDA